jgi:hypothetical protein
MARDQDFKIAGTLSLPTKFRERQHERARRKDCGNEHEREQQKEKLQERKAKI